MGKFEKEASSKIFARESIVVKTRRTLTDLLLWPVYAFKQKVREAKIRKTIRTQYIKQDVEDVDFTYEQAPEVEKEEYKISQDNWLHDIVSEDDIKHKGE